MSYPVCRVTTSGNYVDVTSKRCCNIVVFQNGLASPTIIKVLQGYDVKIHVDAASGGFVAPFVEPELKWDFRLKNVCSINVSGHK